MKKFLPIGSVVLLQESQKRIMIVGVKQKQANSDKVWDYSACLYPEGILDPEKLFEEMMEYKKMVEPFVANVSLYLHEAI